MELKLEAKRLEKRETKDPVGGCLENPTLDLVCC